MRDVDSTAAHSQQNSAIGDHLRISVCCNQGGRKYMEDRINVHCEIGEDGRVDYVFIGVYDGHGGADASKYTHEYLLQNIVKQPGFNSLQDADVLEAIRAGFLETHHAMRKVVDAWPRTASGFTSTSGTTASVALIRRGKLFTGHVGDSGIVLGSKSLSGELIGTSLTVDHKPDSPAEKKRIEQIGGEVMNKSGVMRVVWVRPLRGHQGPVRRSTPKEKIPFLAVARALGDLWSYNSDMDAYVVSPEPDVSVVQLDSTHRCLVFGSDGLWNVLRPQHATDIVNSHEWKEDELNWTVNQNEGYETNHARWLVRHALMRWGNLRADNISVVTVIFGHRSASDSVHAKRIELKEARAVEDVLISSPTSVIKVSPERIVAVPTKPVELVYYGVSETAFERHSILNYFQPATDYYRIPGYTSHEKGPLFNSILSSSTSQSSVGSRPSLARLPSALRQDYWRSDFNSNGSSGKENGASVAPTSNVVAKRASVDHIAVENLEEESSELEDEASTPNITSIDHNEQKSIDSKIGDASSNDGEKRNGSVGENLFKPGQSPCKVHGTVLCCSCSLVRTPLAQWSLTTAAVVTQKEQISVFGEDKTPQVEPAPIEPSARRHTTTSSPQAVDSVDSYKCRKIMRHRRSCPPTTPHAYYTRQSCRTTRAGTKLSPQKHHATPLDGRYKQSRLFNSSFEKSRHRSIHHANSSLSSSVRSRRSAAARHQGKGHEVTPRRQTPNSVVKRRRARKSSNYFEKMRLRSSEGSSSTSSTRGFVFSTTQTQGGVENGAFDPMEEENGRGHAADTNVENLGAQLLESLNLETPLVVKNLSVDADDQTSPFLDDSTQPLNPGSKKRSSGKLYGKKAAVEVRRGASVFVSLKRKLYFDDQALIEQKASSISSTFSKRIKGFGLSFLKRSN